MRRVVRGVVRIVDVAAGLGEGYLDGGLVVDDTKLDSVVQKLLGQQTPTQLRRIGQE